MEPPRQTSDQIGSKLVCLGVFCTVEGSFTSCACRTTRSSSQCGGAVRWRPEGSSIRSPSMDWEDVRYFLALSRSSSIREAGSKLRVSHSTVARRLEALESKLEVHLFNRTPDGYSITAAGARMVQGAERMEAEMASMQRQVAKGDERLGGEVSVTCVEPYLCEMVFEALAPFCRAHPEIELSVESSYSAANLSKREADVALRMFRPGKQPPEHLLGRSIVRVHYASYVATRYAEEQDPGLGAKNSRWLGYGVPQMDGYWKEHCLDADAEPWGSFLGTTLQRKAAHAGIGIAHLPCCGGDRDPNLQRLKSVSAHQWFELWILSHADLRDTERLRKVREVLSGWIQERAPLFEGQRPHSVSA